MGKANDSIKYNRSYPEFNGTDEGMIQHKERSGAKAAALIPTTTFVASATAAMLLLLLALARIALVRPALLTATTNSAQVEVRTDLEGSEDAYPLVYLLVPYEPGQRDPVTPGGRLRLSEQEVEALGDPVLQGEIYTRVEQLLFQGLRMVRIGDPDSPNRPGPIPDDSTPKGPLAIAITPAPATPAPDPATPPQTATSSATATATSSATATATSTATATPYDETTPYIPPTDDSTPTPVVPHGITIRIIGGGQGFAGTDPEHLSSASELQANPGETVYIKGVPEDTDDVHYLFARYEVTSGSVSNWTSSSFVMGSTDVELTFTFVRVRTLTILNAEGGSCNVLTSPFVTMDGQDYYKDGAKVEIEAVSDSTHKLSKFIVNSDDAEDNPLSIFMVSDMTVQPVFAPRATCTIRLDYDVEIGAMSISGDGVSETGDYTYTCLEDTTVQLYANISSDFSDEYRFDHFEVNGSNIGSSSPTSYTVKSDVTITAVFVPLWHWVILDHSPDYISANVWISPSDDVIEEGDGYLCREGAYVTLNAQATDDDEERYVLDHYEVNGSVISNPYLVSSSNVTVTAVFRDLYHTVTIEADPPGEVAAVMPTCGPFKQGETVSFNWWIKDGYSYRTYSITGGVTDESVTSTTCSFTMPDADVTFTAYFDRITHNVTVSVASGSDSGTAAMANTNPVPVGDTVYINVNPATGYEFSYLTINSGDSITDTSFTMPDEDAMVRVYFVEKESYSITLNEILPSSDAASYSISPGPNAPDERYYEGTHITITATANPGYELDSIVAGTHSSSNSPLEFDIADNTGVIIYCTKLTQIVVTQATTEGGTVDTGTFYARPDSTFTVGVHPEYDYGYTVTVNGVYQGANTSFTVPESEGPVTVEVSFFH